MVRGIRRGNFVVKQTWEDKTDAGTAGAADICKNFFERGDGHGDDVTKHYDCCGDGGEASVIHTIASGWSAGFGGNCK